MTSEVLLLALGQVTDAITDLARSANRKLTVELTVIRLCDAGLSGDVAALSARVAQLEQRVAAGVLPVSSGMLETASPTKAASVPPVVVADAPPWEASVPVERPQPEAVVASAPILDETPRAVAPAGDDLGSVPVVESKRENDIWQQVLEKVRPGLDMSIYTLISDGKEVGAALDSGGLNIYIENEFFRGIVEKREVIAALEAAASAVTGSSVRVKCHSGSMPTAAGSVSKLDALTQKGFGNITIK